MSNDHGGWNLLLRIGAAAALATVVMIVVQIVLYVVWPPVFEVEAAFAVFSRDWFRGLQGFDLFMLVDTVFSILVFMALTVALWATNRSLVAIALVFAITGAAAYFSANTGFELLDLSLRHAAADDPEVKQQLLAAGRFALANFQGTGFTVFYVLGGVQTLLVAAAMLRSGPFSRLTGWVGVGSGLTMLVPPIPLTGQLGYWMSLLSLLPLVLWLLLVGRRLWQLGGRTESARA